VGAGAGAGVGVGIGAGAGLGVGLGVGAGGCGFGVGAGEIPDSTRVSSPPQPARRAALPNKTNLKASRRPLRNMVLPGKKPARYALHYRRLIKRHFLARLNSRGRSNAHPGPHPLWRKRLFWRCFSQWGWFLVAVPWSAGSAERMTGSEWRGRQIAARVPLIEVGGPWSHDRRRREGALSDRMESIIASTRREEVPLKGNRYNNNATYGGTP
jgi:hypothetical protein